MEDAEGTEKKPEKTPNVFSVPPRLRLNLPSLSPGY
jgi:hypothetical protein